MRKPKAVAWLNFIYLSGVVRMETDEADGIAR